MAAQEVVHASVQEEAQEDHAAVAEYHHEGHQRAAGAADLQVAEVSPVDLGLFARQRAQAQVGLGRRARAHLGHQQPEVRGSAHIAALGNHGVQPCRGERGELLQRSQDEGPVRVDPAGSQRRGMHRRTATGEYPPHGITMHVQLPRDGAHAPLLHRVQAQDLRHQVRGYGHGAVARAGCGAGSPGARPRAASGRNGGRSSTVRRGWRCGRLRAPKGLRRWRQVRRWCCRASMPPVEPTPSLAGNPGASRSVRLRLSLPLHPGQPHAGPGAGATGVSAAHAPCVRAESAGSAVRPGAAPAHGPDAGTACRSSGCRGRSGYTKGPGRGIGRTGTGGRDSPCAPRHHRSAGRTRPSAPHCCGTAFIGTV